MTNFDLGGHESGILFVSGTASNMSQFFKYFDPIVLLRTPASVIVERIARRTNNNFGKDPDKLASILGHIKTVEPLLQKRATHEIDTNVPIEKVLRSVLQLVEESD